MSTLSPSLQLNASELASLLRAVEPRALLVPQRALRRIVKSHRGIGGLGLHVPHRKTYSICRDALLAIVDPETLGVDPKSLPETLLLIAQPGEWLTELPRPEALRRVWRLLFHARLDLELAQRRSDGRLDDETLRRVKHELGQMELEEASRVLRQEGLLLPPGDSTASLLEFTTVFFELHAFAPDLLACYFPALENLEATERILRGLVDPDPILQQTRLPDAADARQIRTAHEPLAELIEAARQTKENPAAWERLRERAAQARARGNVVRAILLRVAATEAAAPERIDEHGRQLEADFDQLTARLQKALQLSEAEANEWRAALPCLAVPASRGVWPAAARLLFDLQKACVDSERELYALDLVEWAASLGKKKIKRPVPLQAKALLVKHLRSALRRLRRVHIDAAERSRLADLLHDAIHHCEDRLRERIRPLLLQSFQEVGFRPGNLAEEVALHKLTEELLDRVVQRGFINMGDVRDAISRNQLKMPDVSPAQLLLGDPLLKANRKLALALDGVYHRGEIYLRWLQRISSLLFGTMIGRWLTLFVILPFGGALATALFTQEMLHLGRIYVHVRSAEGEAPLPLDDPEVQKEITGIHWSLDLNSALIGLAVLGLFYLLLMHSVGFRAATWRATKRSWSLLRGIFWDFPRALLYWPPVRAVLDSAPVVFFRRRLIRPVLLAAVGVLATLLLGGEGLTGEIYVGTGLFVAGLLFFNSRLGRLADEAIGDWFARNWHWIRVDLVPGLIRLTIDVFRQMLDHIERVIYAVDEWLRFRPGDGRIALVIKPLLGLVWFFLTYLIRVIINLFVEPTVNPVKHFPAVTVGAKLIIPLIPAWTVAMTDVLRPFLGLALAGAIAGTIVILFPGIFGFVVWEFKENWRLYCANRAKVLKPVMIGHHGEKMVQLLRPGFHSGTVPKAFAKMRKALSRGLEESAHKQHEILHHVSESVRHFIEREMIAFLERSKAWGGLPLRVESVKLATNRITISLASPQFQTGPVILAFEESATWLLAHIRRPGFLSALAPEQRTAFETALAGLYKRAAVHLVREQIESAVRPPYRLNRLGLVVTHEGNGDERTVSLVDEHRSDDLARLVFSDRPIPWPEWVAAWERDQHGETPRLPSLEEAFLLPTDDGQVAAERDPARMVAADLDAGRFPG